MLWQIICVHNLIRTILNRCDLLLSISILFLKLKIRLTLFLQKYFVSSHMIIINGANALQSFFAITGFLIAVQFMDLREKHKFKFSFFWKAVIYRYLRFVLILKWDFNRICTMLLLFFPCRYTPVYSFIMLFNATMLYKLRSGPFWPILADTERLACRNSWWANLLYINNFVSSSEPVSDNRKCK